MTRYLKSQSRTTPEPVLDTIPDVERRHPALKGRLRKLVHRAIAGDVKVALLRLAVVRIGSSVYISRPHFHAFLEMHRALPPPEPTRKPRADKEAA
jgi:hypothetical protein